jgi:hypothetical protein
MKFKVGDVVIWNDYDTITRGTIIDVSGDQYVVRWMIDGTIRTYLKSDIRVYYVLDVLYMRNKVLESLI